MTDNLILTHTTFSHHHVFFSSFFSFFFSCLLFVLFAYSSELGPTYRQDATPNCWVALMDTLRIPFTAVPLLLPPSPTTTTTITTTTTADLTSRQDCTVLPDYAGVRCCHPFCCQASAIENNAVMFITLTNLTEMGLCQCQSWNEASVCLGFCLICVYSVFVWVSVLSVCIVSVSGFLSYLCV